MKAPNFDTIEKKVLAGDRVSIDDCRFLFHHPDLLSIGQLANLLRERKNGNKAYYIINHHIDYSNVCVLSCQFCAFAKKEGEEGAFFHGPEYYREKLTQARHEGVTEVHMVGGLHPTLPFDYYTNLMKTIKEAHPTIHLKAFTAVEIDFFSRKFKMSVEAVLDALMEAGLDSMPGGGAEIFNDDVRDQICRGKINAARWLEIHRIAHQKDLRTNATMLYGHVETIDHRIEHMELLRTLQDETHGFLSFIPLAFNPEHTPLENVGWTTGEDDLRTLAISRIFLDNFDHIKTYWVTSGLGIAQLGLSFGADDLHGTVREENISHMAGAKVPQAVTVEDIQYLIREAGRDPCQRDSVYRVIC